MRKKEKIIHLEQAGTLKNFISETEKMNITHLKISGFLNSKDFDFLDDMCSSEVEFDEDDNHSIYFNEPPFLTDLDLGDCYLTDKPYLGDFTYYSKLGKFVCPKNLEGTSDVEVFENSMLLKSVVIPETFKEFGYGTFMNCESLEEINFPDKLKRIGSFSFCNCTSLKPIKIPANVSIIESAAFSGCCNFEKFEIEESNPHFSVLDGVLFNKDKTKLIAFPSGFKNKHYSVPENVEVIGDGSFLDSLIESITFPSSLKIIEGWAFRFCKNLTTIDIPDSVTEIGELAFEFCSNIEKVKLSNKLTVLKRQTFSGCEKLKELYVPASVKSIEETALGWTHNLENLVLNNGLEEIKDDFKFTKLKKLFIPKTVKKIQSGLAILGRSEFHKIEYEVSKENPHFCVINGSLYNKNKTRLIAVFPTDKNQFIVPDGVQIIEDFVFADLDLEQINLPDSITKIKHRCFEDCAHLKKIRLPISLKHIDFRAFDNCKSLGVIEIEAIKPPKITNPSADGWKFVGDAKNLTLYVPKESLNEYKNAFGWKDIKNIETLGDF
ncbi:Leucine rich repeat-containing protein [Mariniphaga anaerophila]|uniref:Leucine rich repeat-containing protein n=1 Tax=Mariniphaga anaerophila TaxID=1484053 RepID=A0A1M5GP17_9BACT|nr:leucine-rich repeat domain-containing protein [Mariniphaga anaerophila]SHG05443.1 Leucine rich repeat-containing protein [Mariniphaga anaerophila]